jgi:hypothetical protein
MGDFIFGFIMGKVIIGVFRLAWWCLRVAWWLAIFLLLWIGAGIMALARIGRPREDHTAGFGAYSQDRTQWRDAASGESYPSSQTSEEHCHIRAAEAGTYWRRTAVARLLRQGAMLRYRFEAVRDDGTVEASREFPNEARRNITLDHLDPAAASTDPYNLTQNREMATEALNDLDFILENKGWQRSDRLSDHWYANAYARPVIDPTPVTLGVYIRLGRCDLAVP